MTNHQKWLTILNEEGTEQDTAWSISRAPLGRGHTTLTLASTTVMRSMFHVSMFHEVLISLSHAVSVRVVFLFFRASVEFLCNEGHIYSTIDDEHFKSTDV